jgi:hypothetical protein
MRYDLLSCALLAALTLIAPQASAETPAADATARSAACAALDPAKPKQRLCEQRTAALSGPLLAETIKSCGQHARSAAGWDACITFAKAQPDAHRIEGIDACNGASENESQLRVCVREASGLTSPVAPVIAECKASATSPSIFAACLKLAAPLKESAAPTIKACSERSSTGAKLSGCLRDAAKLKEASSQGDDPQAALKRACDRAAPPTQRKDCMERASLLHQPDATSIVAECKLYTTAVVDLSRCIEQAAPLKERALQRMRACRHQHTLTADFLACMSDTPPALSR